MRAVFVLPARSDIPIGGFKVVYEYANLLVGRGHEVEVLHPRTTEPPSSLSGRLKARAWVERYRRRPSALAPWFRLDDRVALTPITCLREAEVPVADSIVATTWHTAKCVAEAVPEKGRGFYLIQGYDVWFGGVEEVRATWRLPLHKIAISAWLEEIAHELGEAENTSRVPIGLDFEQLGVDVPPDRRRPRVGALLDPRKGEEEVIAALGLARARIPAVTASCFGTRSRPASLPGWAEYVQLPDADALRRLYNSCAVFLQASTAEGWGLPACEAMACGCALITVENGGSREYALDGRTALVVADPSAEHLAGAIVELLGDEPTRLRLAEAGSRYVSAFTWDRAVEGLEKALLGRAGA